MNLGDILSAGGGKGAGVFIHQLPSVIASGVLPGPVPPR